MTITALPFRTAIAVMVIAVFTAFSISPTNAGDDPPETTTTTTAPATTTTTVPATTTTTAPATTTTVPATTTTTAPATTTTTSAAPGTTTTTTATATTTTTTAPEPTTTTTLPPEPEEEVVEEEPAPDYCDPENEPTGIDTDNGESTSTVTTTTMAPTDGEEVPTGAEIDPCDPPEDDEGEFTPVVRIEVVRDIVFPIAGRAGYYDGFGACRDGCKREHHGIDIGTYGWKGLPVVASHDGTVTRTTYDQRLAGCAVILRGDDGWSTRYVHMNTDFPGTDRSGYSCLAPGIEVGSQVVAGQILGWVGDSGNAENTIPHIHFEIRNPNGVPVNAYESLNAARTIDFDWLSPDASDAYNSIVEANYTEAVSTAVIVSADEAPKLSADESAASVYYTPVIVIDESNPDSALEQIKRLQLDRAIIRTDLDPGWISALVSPLVTLVETDGFPVQPDSPEPLMPDSDNRVPAEVDQVEDNPVDLFATIIARSAKGDQLKTTDDDAESDTDESDADGPETDAEYLAAFDQYTIDHRAAVLSPGAEAVAGLSTVEGSTPTRSEESTAYAARARRSSNSDEPRTPLPIWWNTGDEWVWTDNPLDVPDRGIVYLTQDQATPWTLAFLSSIAELGPMPIWRG